MGLREEKSRAVFHWISSLAMEGELATILLHGGAYKRFEGTIDEAREIGKGVVVAMLADRILNCCVAVSGKAWNSWFFDVAWDSTFIICDHPTNAYWLMCITDTD